MLQSTSAKYLFIVLISALPQLAFAQVINEIFYSPTSKQWIEIFNNTASTIDLTQYKILDGGAAVNGHGITAVAGYASTLSPQSYAVVAKVPDDFTGVSFPLVKSSLGIKTTGDTIVLKTGSTVVDTVSLPSDVATGGSSYRKFDTGWQAASTTAGNVNILPSSTASSTPGSSSTTTTPTTSTQPISAHYSFMPVSNYAEEKLKVSLGRDRLGFVGVPLTFKATINTEDANTMYFWSFGDGDKAEGKEAKHTYLYPGEYVAVLNARLGDNESVSRSNIKVISPDIEVKSADSDKTAVKNNSKYEVNLYGFEMRDGVQHFAFPKDTIIKAGETIYIPYQVTKISPEFGVRIVRAGDGGGLLNATSTTRATSDEHIALEEKLATLKQELAVQQSVDEAVQARSVTLPNVVKEVGVHKEVAPISQVAGVLQAVSINASTTEVTAPQAKPHWFNTLKLFLLGR